MLPQRLCGDGFVSSTKPQRLCGNGFVSFHGLALPLTHQKYFTRIPAAVAGAAGQRAVGEGTRGMREIWCEGEALIREGDALIRDVTVRPRGRVPRALLLRARVCVCVCVCVCDGYVYMHTRTRTHTHTCPGR